MHILRLTASLSVVFAPFLLPGMSFGQSTTQNQGMPPTAMNRLNNGVVPDSINIAQALTGTQPIGTSQPSYTSTPGSNLQTPGNNLQTPGAGLSTPGTLSTPNGQSTSTGQASPDATGAAGTTQTPNGQPLQTSPATTGAAGTTPTPLNGQPVGTTQTTPAGSQVSPTSVLNPPQIIQGAGTVAAPAAQPATTIPTTQQTAPATAAPRTTAPTTPQASPTQLQPGQGALDASLQQATCAQNWQQAIRLVNTAIAATPANQAGYRSQLVSYRSRLQTLQSKGVRASNWAQQCRGGNVANASGQ